MSFLISGLRAQADGLLHNTLNEFDTTMHILQEAADRIEQLEATNAALLQANRDCVDHFNALKADYDASQPAQEPVAWCIELGNSKRTFCDKRENIEGFTGYDIYPVYRASQPAQASPKLTDCRHCGFRVALNEAPADMSTQSEDAQRAMLADRFANRPASLPTADFDLPAPNDQPDEYESSLAPCKAVQEQEQEPCPNLMPVILWLENGCDPKDAAKELRLYQAKLRPGRAVDEPAPEEAKADQFCDAHCTWRDHHAKCPR